MSLITKHFLNKPPVVVHQMSLFVDRLLYMHRRMGR